MSFDSEKHIAASYTAHNKKEACSFVGHCHILEAWAQHQRLPLMKVYSVIANWVHNLPAAEAIAQRLMWHFSLRDKASTLMEVGNIRFLFL